MRKTLLAVVAISAVVGVASCKKSEEEQDATHVPEPAPSAVTPAPIAADSAMVTDTAKPDTAKATTTKL